MYAEVDVGQDEIPRHVQIIWGIRTKTKIEKGALENHEFMGIVDLQHRRFRHCRQCPKILSVPGALRPVVGVGRNSL
jgi:hypothetical protein